MAFLMDANVISETLKRRPEDKVLKWLGDRSPSDLFPTSLSQGELVRGARLMPDPANRRCPRAMDRARPEGAIDGRADGT